MQAQNYQKLKIKSLVITFTILMIPAFSCFAETVTNISPILCPAFSTSQYEEILMTQLRDRKTNTQGFRDLSAKIGELLVNKVVGCLPTKTVDIVTPVGASKGKALTRKLEFVSVMRSGDALLEIFMRHFPNAHVSKILIQRDEHTAKPHFQYKKLSPSITSGNQIVITEPMIATGGSLEMAITLLKAEGVKEEDIMVASICAAPEGLALLNKQFPKIKVALTALDEKLNEKKYIVPGLGDFGDRFFGTN